MVSVNESTPNAIFQMQTRSAPAKNAMLLMQNCRVSAINAICLMQKPQSLSQKCNAPDAKTAKSQQ
jgi:hypothetical protein